MSKSLLWLAAALAGCTSASTEWDRADRALRQSMLKGIVQKCHVPDDALTLNAEGRIVAWFAPDENIERVDCVLARTKRLQITKEMGFVGNEAPGPGRK